jgi:phosphotransferase system HPr (HPr) family protein
MIGVVAVSHSARLGEAAVELALQMAPGGADLVRVAAGAGTDAEGNAILGTDAVMVAEAIDDLASTCEGVVVLMDLGSALMSAELALEFRASAVPVRLAPAPFVEGLLAAVVAAAAGSDLEAVEAEADAALAAKTAQLGGGVAPVPPVAEPPVPVPPVPVPPAPDSAAPAGSGAVTRTVVVRNALGIHARPAAMVVKASVGAEVRLRVRRSGAEASGASLSRLLLLGAQRGDEIEISVSGATADQVLDRIAVLFEEGFGEGVADAEGEVAPPSV